MDLATAAAAAAGGDLDAAPSSLNNDANLRTTSRIASADNYFYSPDLGDLPELDMLPDILDLPNVARDLSYATDLGPGFAPSMPRTTHKTTTEMKEEEDHEDLERLEVDLPEIVAPAAHAAVSVAPGSIGHGSLIPPPPPPSPPPPMNVMVSPSF